MASATPPQEALPLSGSVVQIRLSADPETLDWNRAHTAIESHILHNLMEGLVAHSQKLEVEPALAEKWTRSEDGLRYRFQLRKGVKWSDGKELKAGQFLASWKRLLTPSTGASYAYLLFPIKNARKFYLEKGYEFEQVGIRVRNDYEIEVELESPTPYFLNLLTFWVTFPIREDVLEEHGSAWARPGRMITLGAYQLTSYDQDSLIRLDRNPYYWRGLPPTETILARVVREDVTALRLYEAGKLDILTDLPVLEISRLKKNPEFKVFPYLKTVYLGFQQRKYPTQNVKVRQAIQASLDLRELPKILGGSQVQAGSFLPPEIGGEGKSVWLESRRERARALWKEAALDPLKETKLEILIPNFEKTTMVAQWIQAKLRESLQIEVDIQAFDHKTFRTQLAMGASPLFLLSWSADYPDPENFLSVFSSSSGNNRTGFKSEHYDQLLEAALRELKPERRKQMYRTLDRILTQEQVVIVPLYHEPNLALVKRNLKGVDFSPLNELSLRKVSR